MIHSYQFNRIPLRTGDIICTVDGSKDDLYGRFWLQVGRLLPGKVDHCAIYLGPQGCCVEAGPGGVIVYEMAGNWWNARPLVAQRKFVDRLYGVAYPLAGRNLSTAQEQQIRLAVMQYCLEQAAAEKPYNFNFANPDQETAFYCSQLVYRAYLEQGINLNIDANTSEGLVERIVFPQEIWNSCPHRRAR